MQKLMGAGGACPDEAFIKNRPERPKLRLETIEKLMKQVEDKTGKRGVLIIDSFRGAFRLKGDGENLAGDAGILLRDLQDMALAYHWIIVIIHHKNRSDSVSGTGDWFAAPDMLWTWSRPDIEKPGTLYLEGRMEPVEPMVVKLGLGECEYIGTKSDNEVETDNNLMIAALTNKGQTAEQIAAVTKLSKNTAIYRCINNTTYVSFIIRSQITLHLFGILLDAAKR